MSFRITIGGILVLAGVVCLSHAARALDANNNNYGRECIKGGYVAARCISSSGDCFPNSGFHVVDAECVNVADGLGCNRIDLTIHDPVPIKVACLPVYDELAGNVISCTPITIDSKSNFVVKVCATAP